MIFKILFWGSYILVLCFLVPYYKYSLSLSHIVLVGLILFELKLDYFGSKNLSLYQNTIYRSIFGLFRSTSSIRSGLVYFSKFWSNSIKFGSIRSFGLLQSIWPNSIHFCLFGPLRSIRFTLVYLVHF